MTNLSGKIGKVTVGATNMDVTQWQCTPSSDNPETTNSGTAGFYTEVMGISKCEGSFECNWDTDKVPFASPPNLNPGQVVALKLYIGDPASNKYVDIPTARIASVPIVSEVKGAVKFTCNFVSNGAFTLPT